MSDATGISERNRTLLESAVDELEAGNDPFMNGSRWLVKNKVTGNERKVTMNYVCVSVKLLLRIKGKPNVS